MINQVHRLQPPTRFRVNQPMFVARGLGPFASGKAEYDGDPLVPLGGLRHVYLEGALRKIQAMRKGMDGFLQFFRIGKP